MPIKNPRTRRLAQVVAYLANEIGPRNIDHYPALCSSADYIEVAFSQFGYSPIRQPYEAQGRTFNNIIAERRGDLLVTEVIVIGAHYDSHKDSPGADDNNFVRATLLGFMNFDPKLRELQTLRLVTTKAIYGVGPRGEDGAPSNDEEFSAVLRSMSPQALQQYLGQP